LKPIGTFGTSSYQIQALQLFRGADSLRIAPLLKDCPIVQVEPGAVVADPQRARLYIVLRGALSVAADTRTGMSDGTISKILPGESVGEQAVLDE
jgi:CRP-like cAMP-binding protein